MMSDTEKQPKILLDKRDFERIGELAIKTYIAKGFPKYLGRNKEAVGDKKAEAMNLCLIEATIAYLNSKDLLKQVPKFNYQ